MQYGEASLNNLDISLHQPREFMNNEILQTLSTYIAINILKQPKRMIKPDEPLLSNGLVDSFSLVDLSLFIEKEFNVYIDNTELNKETFDTLSQLTSLVQSRM